MFPIKRDIGALKAPEIDLAGINGTWVLSASAKTQFMQVWLCYCTVTSCRVLISFPETEIANVLSSKSFPFFLKTRVLELWYINEKRPTTCFWSDIISGMEELMATCSVTLVLALHNLNVWINCSFVSFQQNLCNAFHSTCWASKRNCDAVKHWTPFCMNILCIN